MTGVFHCDTLEEYENNIKEMVENPDFTLVGYFDLMNDIYDEMEYQGFNEEQTRQLTMNRYGTCLEIYEYASEYTVFFGQR